MQNLRVSEYLPGERSVSNVLERPAASSEQRAPRAVLTDCKRFSNEAQTRGDSAALQICDGEGAAAAFLRAGKTTSLFLSAAFFRCGSFSDGTVGKELTLRRRAAPKRCLGAFSQTGFLEAESLQVLIEPSSPNWAKESSGSPFVGPTKGRR